MEVPLILGAKEETAPVRWSLVPAVSVDEPVTEDATENGVLESDPGAESLASSGYSAVARDKTSRDPSTKKFFAESEKAS